MTDDQNGTYVIVVNSENQHSLWPSFAEVPKSWRIVHGPDKRQACLDYVKAHWTDMHPKSLIEVKATGG